MKKFFLSVLVIIGFVLYAYTIRAKSASQSQAILPNTVGKRILIPPTVTPVSPTPAPTSKVVPAISLQTNIPTATPKPSSQYKDGTFTGSVADAFYGNVQIQVTISGGKITSVQFLQTPNDRDTSIEINQQADPMLSQEAIQAQSAQVDIVSGATQTSQAFVQSLQSALSQAKS